MADGTCGWVGTDDGACVSMHMLVGSGGMLPKEKFTFPGGLRSLLRPCLFPNATSLTRIHGGSTTAVHYNTCQPSQGVSVTRVDLVHVGPDEVGIL